MLSIARDVLARVFDALCRVTDVSSNIADIGIIKTRNILQCLQSLFIMGEVDSSMTVEIMFLSFAVPKLDALDPKS
jgi:hypothetical protein